MAKRRSKTVYYEEGGIEGMMLVSNNGKEKPIETFRVKLEKLRKPPMNEIRTPEDVVKTLKEMKDYDREHVKLLHLDTHNRVTGIEETSIGQLDFAVVHPRETIKAALLNNSANVIFVHNHPSGDCGYSKEDKEVYEKLKKAFNTVDVGLIDGIVIGKGCFYSFAKGAKGKINNNKKKGGTQTSLRVEERRKRKKAKSKRRR